MRIAGLKTFVVDAFRANYVFVKVLTDEGLHGLGEGTVEHRERAVAAAIEEFAPILLGQNPFATDLLVERMSRDSYWRSGRPSDAIRLLPHRGASEPRRIQRPDGELAARQGPTFVAVQLREVLGHGGKGSPPDAHPEDRFPAPRPTRALRR